MGEPKSRIERRKVSDLKRADYNPRSMTKKAFAGLQASVERFGLVQPIIVNERTGLIVGGHQRLDVLLESDIEEVDVVVVDLDDSEEKALNVTLNNKAIQGTFTGDLQSVLNDIADEDGDQLLLAELSGLGGGGSVDVPEPKVDFKEWSSGDVKTKACFVFRTPLKLQAEIRAMLEERYPDVVFEEEVVYQDLE